MRLRSLERFQDV